MDDESAPALGRYLWSYEVSFANTSDSAIRLLRREWTTSDATGAIERYAGVGVLGQQPTIEPGASYTYRSWIQLPTATGTMVGRFWFRGADGQEFSASSPTMVLVTP